MPFVKKIKVGNLLLKVTAAKTTKNVMLESLKHFKSPAKEDEPSYDIRIYFYKSYYTIYKTVPKGAKSFLKNYLSSLVTAKFDSTAKELLKDAFNFWSKTLILRDKFKKCGRNSIKRFVIYSLDSRRLMNNGKTMTFLL